MTKFFNIFKIPLFWPIFGPFLQFWGVKKIFLENPADTHNFIWVSSIMPKFRKKLKIQFQENAQTDGRADGRMEGWKDRRTDRPYFIGPFQLTPGVQKKNKNLPGKTERP